MVVLLFIYAYNSQQNQDFNQPFCLECRLPKPSVAHYPTMEQLLMSLMTVINVDIFDAIFPSNKT